MWFTTIEKTEQEEVLHLSWIPESASKITFDCMLRRKV
jgi:hypothetical protein